MGEEDHIKPLKFGLIGKHLSHSFSKDYFEKSFNKTYDTVGVYKNIELANEKQVKDFCQVDVFKYKGFNVTIPYKVLMLDLISDIQKDAAAIGAINTVKIKDKKLIGYNTDWIGFYQSIEPLLTSKINQALILGKGGASKAVAYGLQRLNIPYQFVSRSKKKGLLYTDLTEEIIEQSQIIVNTTPLGMFPEINDLPKIPYKGISDKHIVMDLIYNPKQTQFLAKANAQGASILNGQKMLEIQARESWKIWMH